MNELDLDRDTGRPLGLTLLLGALVVIGAITVFGWLFGAIVTLVKLAVLVGVVLAVVVAIRALARR
jgi:hypothetical protein